MFEQRHRYQAFWLPGPHELSIDEAVARGLHWLLSQPGTPLVALSLKGNLRTCRLLNDTVTRARLSVVVPPRMLLPGWPGGAVLAPWASQRVLDGIDNDLAGSVNAACAIEWVPGGHDDWRAARDALHLRDAEHARLPPALDAVVVAAMTEASHKISHDNALVQMEDKAYVIRTLQKLVEAGHRYDVSSLCSWAATNGFQAVEVMHLRDYATRVLEGRRCQLRGSAGPSPDALARWRSATADLTGPS